jgi:hypothetical protein
VSCRRHDKGDMSRGADHCYSSFIIDLNIRHASDVATVVGAQCRRAKGKGRGGSS